MEQDFGSGSGDVKIIYLKWVEIGKLPTLCQENKKVIGDNSYASSTVKNTVKRATQKHLGVSLGVCTKLV
jgi:hypothetical protein